jgi:DNA replication and repair protein RecF
MRVRARGDRPGSSMQKLSIESLTTRGFRNLAAAEISLGPRFNVVHGDNGQGKTNLLEAVYVVATSRSFRTHRAAELVQHGADTCSVRARIVEGGLAREQVVGVGRGLRQAKVDGKRPRTLAEYAVLTPVVAFHPGSLLLSTGAGSERRRLLDRIALYRGPASRDDAESYAEALRGRQRVLELRGDASPELDDREALVARHGAALTLARADAARALAPLAEEVFGRIGAPGLRLRVEYRPGGMESVDEFRRALAANRTRDRMRGSATVGPHRDDLALDLDGRASRGLASQGQHRAIVLALELAEIGVIGAARDVQPLLLLDDVSSELDRGRTAALVGALRGQEGQVVLTTTRPELIETLDGGGPRSAGPADAVERTTETPSEERRDFELVAGVIRPR